MRQKLQLSKPYVYSLHLSRYAEYLRRTGMSEQARKITEANLETCQERGWQDYISLNLRILADLETEFGKHKQAGEYYDEALKIIRHIVRRDILIDVLLARGHWHACFKHANLAAHADLHEALELAVNSGYRIFEADIRITLAWAYIAETLHTSVPRIRGTAVEQAKLEVARARRISESMGYYWAQKDAKEVEKVIENYKD